RPEASTLTSWRCQAYGSTTVPTSRLCGRSSITGKLWRNGIVCSYASSKVKGLKLEPPELYDPRLSGSGFGGGNGTQTEVDDAWARARCWRYTMVCVKSTVVSRTAEGKGTVLVCPSTRSVPPEGMSSSDDPGWRAGHDPVGARRQLKGARRHGPARRDIGDSCRADRGYGRACACASVIGVESQRALDKGVR